MPTEDDLRDLFASARPTGEVDARRVIARAKARRLPRQIAAGALSGLAVAAVLVVGIQAALPSQQPSIATLQQPAAGPAAESAASGAASDSAVKRAPADKLNLCGGSLADVAPSGTGLQLDVAFPATAPVDSAVVEGTVHLTNTGAERVTGTTASSPAITLSQEGIVLWHSNGPVTLSAFVVDLAPGESADYRASFVPVRCDVSDDESESFRADLPPLPAGIYDLSAAIDFIPDVPTTDRPDTSVALVTGPVSTIELR